MPTLGRIMWILWFCLMGLHCNKDGSNPVGVFVAADQLPATFTVNGTSATINGKIDIDFIGVISEIITQHPEVKTLILQKIPGSDISTISFEAGRMIRNAGLNTHIPADGAVASGGTDLFLSGVVRTVEQGGRVGVHAWLSEDPDGNQIIGSEIPQTDNLHLFFLSYYNEMGIDVDFYWFALDAAPPTSIHWMTNSELSRFSIITQN